MNIEKYKKINVKYNGVIVGYLAEYEDGAIAFQYDSEWLKSGFSISPFSLPLSNKIFINNKTTFDGLFGVFAGSMPDGWGELLVRRMLKKYDIDYDKLSPLQKLTIINKNGLGALEYEPHNQINTKIGNFNLDELAQESEKILNDDINSLSLDEIYNLGGSSGGTRPKAHITYNDEEWIVKFPCLIDPKNIGEQEYKANELAKKCGIIIPNIKLFESNICTGYFGSKRYDRNGAKRVHTISLAALLETSHRIPNMDYGHLFQVISRICVNRTKDTYEAYKRMCFNVLYKNKDDHSKNFEFIYDESLKGYTLSPAFDLTPTPNKVEHEMTVNNNGNPTEKDLIEFARIYHLSDDKCKAIINNIRNIIL